MFIDTCNIYQHVDKQKNTLQEIILNLTILNVRAMSRNLVSITSFSLVIGYSPKVSLVDPVWECRMFAVWFRGCTMEAGPGSFY